MNVARTGWGQPSNGASQTAASCWVQCWIGWVGLYVPVAGVRLCCCSGHHHLRHGGCSRMPASSCPLKVKTASTQHAASAGSVLPRGSKAWSGAPGIRGHDHHQQHDFCKCHRGRRCQGNSAHHYRSPQQRSPCFQQRPGAFDWGSGTIALSSREGAAWMRLTATKSGAAYQAECAP